MTPAESLPVAAAAPVSKEEEARCTTVTMVKSEVIEFLRSLGPVACQDRVKNLLDVLQISPTVLAEDIVISN